MIWQATLFWAKRTFSRMMRTGSTRTTPGMVDWMRAPSSYVSPYSSAKPRLRAGLLGVVRTVSGCE